MHIKKEYVVVKSSQRQTIAIAGATGFIGRALCAALSEDFNVVALSRSPSTSKETNIQWRSCDLYSLSSCIDALRGVDRVVYLVHSMMPSARLTQARFEDLDVILADNFAKAAHANGIRHAVYVGGLDPETADTSVHLNSRMEVEVALERWIETVTALRAGLVIGKGGSSFELLYKVVHRLPLILCPRWTYAQMQPIALGDLLLLIKKALELSTPPAGCHDIGGHDIMTYRMLIERSAKLLGLNRVLIDIPFLPARLSSLGVGLLTNTPQSLVFPLIQSLKHDMLAKNTSFQDATLSSPQSFEEAFKASLQGAGNQNHSKQKRASRTRKIKEESSVRSIQRMKLPSEKDAHWVAEEYLRWLPHAFKILIRAERLENGVCRMYLQWTKILLLELSLQTEQSSAEQAIYFISGGLLVRKNTPHQGIFEFRVVLNKKYVMAAIHNFFPRLPWYIYMSTQAIVHAFVMKRFTQHLAAFAQEN